MATEFKCDYCNAALHQNATLVHTERYHGLWDLDCSMCQDCFKHLKGMLEKVKSQKSWTGWAAREQEVESLKKQVESLKKVVESLKSELQFLRFEDDICDWPIANEPHYEVVTVAMNGCDPIKAHRSILISRSEVLKKVLTSAQYKNQFYDGRHKTSYGRRSGQIALMDTTMHPDSFRAFIKFLYTAELSPEVLKDHAPELMTAGDLCEIQLLKLKCQGYMLNNMTTENTLNYLKVAAQRGWTVITEAAVKKMQNNPEDFFSGHDYQTLVEDHPAVLAAAFKFTMDPHPPGRRKSKHAVDHPKPAAAATETVAKTTSTSGPAAAPGWDPHNHERYPMESSFRSLGTCTCSVHPFAHSASPAFQYEYRGVHFSTATAQPSTVNYVNPPTSSAPDA